MRVLLAMQDLLSQLEKSLAQIDLQSSTVEAPDVKNGSFRQDANAERVRLFAELQTALLEYSEFCALPDNRDSPLMMI